MDILSMHLTYFFFDETAPSPKQQNSSQRAMNRLLFPSVGEFLGSKKLFPMIPFLEAQASRFCIVCKHP